MWLFLCAFSVSILVFKLNKFSSITLFSCSLFLLSSQSVILCFFVLISNFNCSISKLFLVFLNLFLSNKSQLDFTFSSFFICSSKFSISFFSLPKLFLLSCSFVKFCSISLVLSISSNFLLQVGHDSLSSKVLIKTPKVFKLF